MAIHGAIKQTWYKIKPFPVILYDSAYWRGFLDWLRNTTLARGYVSEEDFGLLRVCDHPHDVANTINKWYTEQRMIGEKALIG